MTKLDELEKLSKEATPGPWYVPDNNVHPLVINGDKFLTYDDSCLIVAMRNNIDALIKVAKAAHGLSFGVDWNKGTHAEIYRPKLIEALAELKETK